MQDAQGGCSGQEEAWNLPALLGDPSPPRRCVLIYHACPMHGEHVDWMFEPPGKEGHMLPSARVVTLDADQSGVSRPDHTRPGQQLWLERYPDHRSAYLDDSDAPRQLSGGSGTVHMVATGTFASDGSPVPGATSMIHLVLLAMIQRSLSS